MENDSCPIRLNILLFSNLMSLKTNKRKQNEMPLSRGIIVIFPKLLKYKKASTIVATSKTSNTYLLMLILNIFRKK
jgi:hypothetical protein